MGSFEACFRALLGWVIRGFGVVGLGALGWYIFLSFLVFRLISLDFFRVLWYYVGDDGSGAIRSWEREYTVCHIVLCGISF